MSNEPPSSTLFEDAINVPLWLEQDCHTPHTERLQRDRTIGRQSAPTRRAAGKQASVAQARSWWQHIEHDPAHEPGHHLDALRRIIVGLVTIIGLISGSALAFAAFHYTGTNPINVVRALALLVGVQSLFLIATLLLLPGHIPGLRTIQDAIASVNIGALAGSLFRRLGKPSPGLAPLFAWHSGRATAANRFAKWQLLHWAQTAAVAFNCAALLTAVGLIAFTDLAFGWSTTLNANPETVADIVDVAAWPWHAWIPGAVPSLELISKSQYFRLGSGTDFSMTASRTLTGWWSFTVLCIVMYGLIPRMLLLAFARIRLTAAERSLLLDDARVGALFERMNAPAIEMSTDDEETGESPLPSTKPSILPDRARPEGSAAGIVWSQAIDMDSARDYARIHLGLALSTTTEAGGALELAQDQAAIQTIASSGQATIVILTPGWEPPVLDFMDFLATLRHELSPATTLLVSPVGEQSRPVSTEQGTIWSQAIARLADPQTLLAAQ